jgi:hypothetical protein
MSGGLKCIVPLAGPDLIHPEHGPRPLMPVDGAPLIDRALRSRAWAPLLASQDYVFVLRNTPGVEAVTAHLLGGYPGCRIVMLSHLTGGAMLSALAGAALLPVDAGPLVVDLADILFSGGPADTDLTNWPVGVGGMVPWFHSDDPRYSYLRCEGDSVLETAEKRVISDRASAGVYVFRDLAVFTAAAAHSLANRQALAFRDALFVCPMMNGVIAAGLSVRAIEVDQVVSLSTGFHDGGLYRR